jgi:hypothetical protein
MNRKIRNMLIVFSSIVLVLGVYGLLMFSLKDFNDPLNTNGLRLDDTDDDSRTDYQFTNVTDSDTPFKDVGRMVGELLWEAKGVDIIIMGIMLFVASESAATVVKGIENQRSEFRKEMVETDKFVILERKDAEDLVEEEG